MSTSPAPSVVRGDITLQPSYFTSSLFVEPLREDIAHLVQNYAQAYLQPTPRDALLLIDEDVAMGEDNNASSSYVNASTQPFTYFKILWTDYGWSWLHFKVFDGRARESFIRTVLRCFTEYIVDVVNPLAQTVALFGMYTFFMSQPSSSGPSLHRVTHIAVPLDMYKSLLELPQNLAPPHLLPLQPYAIHILRTLLDSRAFHVLPRSSLRAQCPSELPREQFVADASAEPPAEGTTPAKKKGRPSKRDKVRKAKDAVVALDKWVDKNTYTYPGPTGPGESTSPRRTTHTLISHPPTASQAIYIKEKTRLLDIIDTPRPDSQAVAGSISPGLLSDGIWPSAAGATVVSSHGVTERDALGRANEAVLARLEKIDEMAAERGLEVGGEGGDKTGLARVERAVKEYREGKTRGGILSLLEGAGLAETNTEHCAAGERDGNEC